MVSGAGIVSLTLSPPLSFIEEQYGAFGRELQNLEPLWARFAPLLGQMEEQRFDTQGFGEWPGLADSTLQQKERLGFPPDPLIRTGALKESLVNPEQAARMTPMMMTYGTNVEYAHWHQDGGSIPGRPPQRQVLTLNVQQRQRLEQEMVAWINEVAARTFRAAA